MAVDRIMADIQRRAGADSFTIEINFIDGHSQEFDFLKCESGYLALRNLEAPEEDVVFVPFAAVTMLRPIWH